MRIFPASSFFTLILKSIGKIFNFIGHKQFKIMSAFLLISITLMLATLAQTQLMMMNWAMASKRGPSAGEMPVISISSVLRDPRQLPFNQLLAGSDWHGKVLNQIQGYNELFRDLDIENGRRRRRSAAARNERGQKFGCGLREK